MVNEKGHGLGNDCLGAAHAANLIKKILIFTYYILMNIQKNKLIPGPRINRHDGKQ